MWWKHIFFSYFVYVATPSQWKLLFLGCAGASPGLSQIVESHQIKAPFNRRTLRLRLEDWWPQTFHGWYGDTSQYPHTFYMKGMYSVRTKLLRTHLSGPMDMAMHNFKDHLLPCSPAHRFRWSEFSMAPHSGSGSEKKRQRVTGDVRSSRCCLKVGKWVSELYDCELDIYFPN